MCVMRSANKSSSGVSKSPSMVHQALHDKRAGALLVNTVKTQEDRNAKPANGSRLLEEGWRFVWLSAPQGYCLGEGELTDSLRGLNYQLSSSRFLHPKVIS